MITGTQCKMARVAMGWSVRDLGKLAELHFTSIARFEAGGAGSDIRISSLARLEKVFADYGVEFPDTQTVKVPPGIVNTLAAAPYSVAA